MKVKKRARFVVARQHVLAENNFGLMTVRALHHNETFTVGTLEQRIHCIAEDPLMAPAWDPGGGRSKPSAGDISIGSYGKCGGNHHCTQSSEG